MAANAKIIAKIYSYARADVPGSLRLTIEWLAIDGTGLGGKLSTCVAGVRSGDALRADLSVALAEHLTAVHPTVYAVVRERDIVIL